ncbi:hypothetical protein WA026_012855 [Henosepilachna vigintioctopunctata]|uniref:Uncharacterized protein n=1 Tax=Henosepilachna vigintioctopunctata TaxID=420089 RepID=A0AAW1TK18_9CUCU
MFTLPPWPPKDYILKTVANRQQSSSAFTPLALPRATQTNLAKYLYPVEYADSDKVEPQIREVHPKIIEKWGDTAKAWLVDQPGKNAHFLHQLHKQFSSDDGIDYNPIFQHKEKVFNRPFSFELDCMEFRRLKKLQEKSDYESKVKCDYISKFEEAKKLKKQEQESIKVLPCNFQPPFWWDPKSSSLEQNENNIQLNFNLTENGTFKEGVYSSWQEIPNPFTISKDPCVRRNELLQVGLPFRNDGCNWYYKIYPPPKYRFRQKKFSK